ncbi:VWA domain-containing protein, partial [Candidatus Thorarchaeota archaeon]
AYDLTVGVLGDTDTESVCVIYDTIVFDSVIVVDHSGSMSVFDKMDAAKESARLYVDSFATPEMLALVEFNESAQLLQGLADATGIREVVLSRIDEIIIGGLTSVGGGMLVAQDELYLNGGAGHRNHIVLLTDGRENTPPTISHVRPLLLGNNTLLDVVLIGEDAQVGLLEEIARETGGNLYHVPEPSSGTLTTDLASIYRSIAERIHRQQRVYSSQKELSGSWLVQESFYLDSVSEATVVFSYRADQSLGSTSPQLELPDTTLVSPTYSRESESETSGDFYGHFLWEIPASQTGTYDFSLTGSGDIEYLCEAAVKNQVSIRLAADTGPAIRYVGERVPILVTLQDGSPINAANVWAHITSGANYSEQMVCDLPLYDDGAHADALANDGIYGNIFTRTTGRALEYLVLDGITFRVSIKANGTSSGGASFSREALGAFHLIRPTDWDQDSDNLPDMWEDRYGLDSNSSLGDDGYDGDPDGDYLLNAEELQQGTNPMECDTDWGGESDYSEVQFGRSPLYPADDYFFDVSMGAGAFPHCQLKPGDANVTIFYSMSTVVTNPSINTFRASGTEGDYSLLVSGITGNKGQYLDAGVANGQDYYYRVAVTTSGGERSRYSAPTGTTPKVDLVPPHGAISIDGGNRTSGDQHVILNVFTGEDATQIRISNNPRFEGAAWQPVNTINDIPWTLDSDGVQFVYAQFRDAYGNIGGSHNGTRAFDAIRVGQTPAAPPRPDSLLVAAVVGAATVVVVVLVLVIKKRR